MKSSITFFSILFLLSPISSIYAAPQETVSECRLLARELQQRQSTARNMRESISGCDARVTRQACIGLRELQLDNLSRMLEITRLRRGLQCPR